MVRRPLVMAVVILILGIAAHRVIEVGLGVMIAACAGAVLFSL